MRDDRLFFRLREKIPRLRVRELLILVVYAALIGQAFLLASAGPANRTRDIPSEYRYPGYAWVRASDVQDFPPGPDGQYHYLIRESHAGWIQNDVSISSQHFAALHEAYMTSINRDGSGLDIVEVFVLVPEDWAQ